MYEKDANYAAQRLNNTIIRLKEGTPILVMDVKNSKEKENPEVTYQILGSKDEIFHRCLYKAVDVTPVPLGFALTNRGAMYLQRQPKRNDWRQGLRRANYVAAMGGDKRRLTDKQLRDCINGKYLNMELALDESDNLGLAVPWCREFAFKPSKNRMGIHYKWFGEVGTFVNDLPDLHEGFDHLNELLEERLQ